MEMVKEIESWDMEVIDNGEEYCRMKRLECKRWDRMLVEELEGCEELISDKDLVKLFN